MKAPKYQSVASAIEADILTGRIPTGEAIAGEHELVRRFRVSRNTVRRGLEVLAGKGLIDTRVGRGSFVTYDGERIDDSAGWTVALSGAAQAIGSRLVGIGRGPLDLSCDAIPEGTDCLKVDRMRFRVETGRGVSLERSRVPWRDALAPVLEEGLKEGSLTATLLDLGLSCVSGEERANVATALSAEDAALLGRAPGGPMLHLRRVARGVDGAVIEYVESLLDPDHFGLRMTF